MPWNHNPTAKASLRAAKTRQASTIEEISCREQASAARETRVKRQVL